MRPAESMPVNLGRTGRHLQAPPVPRCDLGHLQASPVPGRETAPRASRGGGWSATGMGARQARSGERNTCGDGYLAWRGAPRVDRETATPGTTLPGHLLARGTHPGRAKGPGCQVVSPRLPDRWDVQVPLLPGCKPGQRASCRDRRSLRGRSLTVSTLSLGTPAWYPPHVPRRRPP